MCYYRLYIFVGCGHSTFSETPVRHCKDTQTKSVKKSKSPSTQHEDLATGGESSSGSSRKGRDSQMTLVPDDDSNERTDKTTKCGDNSQTLHSAVQTDHNKTYHTDLLSTTDVLLTPNADGRTALSHMTSPTIISRARTSPPNPPALEDNDTQSTCEEGRVHPLHTVRLERMCPLCEQEKEKRLRLLYSSMREIRFDPAKWHVKYQGDVKLQSDGTQQTGAGWGVAMGGWWDRSKKEDKDSVT